MDESPKSTENFLDSTCSLAEKHFRQQLVLQLNSSLSNLTSSPPSLLLSLSLLCSICQAAGGVGNHSVCECWLETCQHGLLRTQRRSGLKADLSVSPGPRARWRDGGESERKTEREKEEVDGETEGAGLKREREKERGCVRERQKERKTERMRL